MSTKQHENSSGVRLFCPLAILILSMLIVFSGLIALRSTNESIQERDGRDYVEYAESRRLLLLATIARSMTDIRDEACLAISEIEAAKTASLDSENQSQETPYDIYSSYVDTIISTNYPSLDPEYVKAIIYHESRYDPNAVNSRTGVMGLMQINPKWHTKRAEKLGVTDLLDPYGNILVGCDLLNELTQQYDFNYALNFFAGGYPYANVYTNSLSPYVSEINDIIGGFKSGAIVLGGD